MLLLQLALCSKCTHAHTAVTSKASSLYVELHRCSAEDVFLQPIADKFVRLVLQLLARYSCWLTDGLAGKPAGSSTQPAQNGTAQVTSGLWVHCGLLLLVCTQLQQLNNLCQVYRFMC